MERVRPADNVRTSPQRRRRRIARSMREKTPDPKFRENGRRQSNELGYEEQEYIMEKAMDDVQIRHASNSRSAHESKILRRRDKNFSNIAARSHSQPRQAERLSSPEAQALIRTAKRSLSSPRQKEEGVSESDISTEPYYSRNTAVLDEGCTRLQQNLRRFEEERKRFEAEKRQFEKERLELKLRNKQMYDSEERRRFLQTYHQVQPKDVEERRRLVHSLRLQRNELPNVLRRPGRYSSTCAESSTQLSSSETEDSTGANSLAKNLSPQRKNIVVTARGPPPVPPVAPARQSLSRNNSLSPIRPERRSKTPENRAEIMRRLAVETADIRIEKTLVENKDQIFREPQTEDMQLRRRKKSLEENSNEAERRECMEITQNVQKPVLKTEVPELTENLNIASRKPLTFIESLKLAFRKSAKHSLAPINIVDSPTKGVSTNFIKHVYNEICYEWKCLKADYPNEMLTMKELRNKCISHIIFLILFCGFGGLLFRYTEGSAENTYKCEVRKVKRDFIENLWAVSHNMREDDWKLLARQKLRKFEEELQELNQLGMRYYYPGQKSWNFVNCILYCWTVITTIGYGHITPKTTLGQTLTIVYAIIGIPIFLILLADFGKLFTRMMKFIWAYVRRLYYTGRCRRIRKQQQFQDAIGGFNAMYDIAVRRPSAFFGINQQPDIESQMSDAAKSSEPTYLETPTTPYPETYEIDDEFNLPISLASILLISYILVGTFVYTLWEDWTYFEAFYFVFISMSTIGFGDLVPNHPIFMMCSIIYLIFGLALTSMFINVVQIKLSDTFKQASSKLGATIGLGLPSEMGDDSASQVKTPSELAQIHGTRLDKIAESEQESAHPPPVNRQDKPRTGAGDELSLPKLEPKPQTPVNENPEVDKNEKKKRRRFFK